MDDTQLKPKPEVIIEEVKRQLKKEQHPRRGSSQVAMKMHTSSNFTHAKDDQTVDKIY